MRRTPSAAALALVLLAGCRDGPQAITAPVDPTGISVHDGSAGRILAERREKLAAARHRRRQENLKIRQRELPLPTTWKIPSPEPTANQPVSHFV
jgi:hypothetical protein